ncbi:DNA-binding protein [Embleya sp. NPDC050154]|uniref:DNA-binding protein n=1 Tax=Embleya sp. NPDC050154 TaxID=3363988 RepID=UPI003798369F
MGTRESADFPEWIRLHHPHDAAKVFVLLPDLAKDLARARDRAWSAPKTALGIYQRIAHELSVSYPHLLPALHEYAGRVFLSTRHATFAAQMLGAARLAEAEHGLSVDDEHVDEVFLEFAVADALPAKAVAEYSKDLTTRFSGAEAFRRFTRLCVRRTEAGLAPSAQMASAVRRLARAAGDQAAREQAYLAEMLALPAVIDAPSGWWSAHRPALVDLARRDPAVRGMLLKLMPGSHANLTGDQTRALIVEWLALLEASGATAGLGDGAQVSAPERPADGTAGWLDRVLRAWGGGWGGDPRLPLLHAVVTRVADRLRSELIASGRTVAMGRTLECDLDLLDLLLALDVPVADPGPLTRLEPLRWAEQADRRDLLSLAAEPRFAGAFGRGADGFYNDGDHLRAVRTLAASPGGRTLLTGWVCDVARRSAVAEGLPQLPAAHGRLAWLPDDIVALAPEEVAAAARVDLVRELVRTLRGGLLDELSWPDFEDATGGGRTHTNPVMADAWPHLIVAKGPEVRVLGPEGCVLRHEARLPPERDRRGRPAFHFVDGALLVYWRTYPNNLFGYWHRPDAAENEVVALRGKPDPEKWSLRTGAVSLPVPGGGRTTGGGTLRPGDDVVPDELPVIGDGTTFRVWDESSSSWLGHDPTTGERGDLSALDFPTAAPPSRHAWVRPAPSAESTPLGVPVDGLLAWEVTVLPDGSMRGRDLAGRSVTMPARLRDDYFENHPFGALTLPGDARLRTLVRNRDDRVLLLDPDGVVTAVADERFVAGHPTLPPTAYWSHLRPRDPQGSAALRAIDHETAAALLKAATAEGVDLPGTVRALLPGIGSDTLAAGVAGVVRFTAERQAVLDGVADRLVAHRRPEREFGDPRTDPSDSLLGKALAGLYLSRYSKAVGFHGIQGVQLAFRQLRALLEALRDERPSPAAGEIDERLHFGGAELRSSSVPWGTLLGVCDAVAFRAAAPTTPREEREALRRLLESIDVLGLDSARDGHWRRVELRLEHEALVAARWRSDWHDSSRGVLRLPDGAFLVVVAANDPEHGSRSRDSGCDFTALFHDPTGRFEVPAPYTVTAVEPIGADREPGALRAFLAEWAERGQFGWNPAAADEFAEATGVSRALARLVVAGLPAAAGKDAPAAELREMLGLKPADTRVAAADVARLALDRIPAEVVAALLPADPARLWTDGPDVTAAIAVWNARVGRRMPLPDALLAEAAGVPDPASMSPWQQPWPADPALRAVLDPTSSPELTRDLGWRTKRGEVSEAGPPGRGFSNGVLVGTTAMAAWLAHRLPAGDPLRNALSTALGLIRERLSAAGMVLEFGPNVHYGAFREAAGSPHETGDGWERYGAVVIAALDWDRYAGIVSNLVVRTDLLDEAGSDPYLREVYALDEWTRRSEPTREALRLAFDPAFAALLADPGDPAAGGHGPDGTWWPQDPTRSVPDLVGELGSVYGLGEDAVAMYLMLLAMPDPTDRNVARWTGWKPARLTAARAELATTELVLPARRARAGRSLFVPGEWLAKKSPQLPLEAWKLPLFGLTGGQYPPLGVLVPLEPAADLYRRAWRRVQEGDAPDLA